MLCPHHSGFMCITKGVKINELNKHFLPYCNATSACYHHCCNLWEWNEIYHYKICIVCGRHQKWWKKMFYWGPGSNSEHNLGHWPVCEFGVGESDLWINSSPHNQTEITLLSHFVVHPPGGMYALPFHVISSQSVQCRKLPIFIKKGKENLRSFF